jgi:hypothetical protein
MVLRQVARVLGKFDSFLLIVRGPSLYFLGPRNFISGVELSLLCGGAVGRAVTTRVRIENRVRRWDLFLTFVQF